MKKILLLGIFIFGMGGQALAQTATPTPLYWPSQLMKDITGWQILQKLGGYTPPNLSPTPAAGTNTWTPTPVQLTATPNPTQVPDMIATLQAQVNAMATAVQKNVNSTNALAKTGVQILQTMTPTSTSTYAPGTNTPTVSPTRTLSISSVAANLRSAIVTTNGRSIYHVIAPATNIGTNASDIVEIINPIGSGVRISWGTCGFTFRATSTPSPIIPALYRYTGVDTAQTAVTFTVQKFFGDQTLFPGIVRIHTSQPTPISTPDITNMCTEGPGTTPLVLAAVQATLLGVTNMSACSLNPGESLVLVLHTNPYTTTTIGSNTTIGFEAFLVVEPYPGSFTNP